MSLRLARTIAEVREALQPARRFPGTIGLVPTMGALHAGHGRLLERAREENSTLAVSIFVNPIQFDRREDFDSYPRPLETDLEFCRDHGADVVFAPPAAEMYPHPLSTFVEVTGVSEHLCGRFRPGHFRGVSTVVMKLFQIVHPHRAYFGEKDAQQLAVIRRMVRDLNVPIEIREVPTVREADGLALSSRNRLLDAAGRRAAPVLYAALQLAGRMITEGERDPQAIRRNAAGLIESEPLARIEYFEVVDPCEMQPVERIGGSVRIAGAIWIGRTRLIDNLLAIAPPA